ncbi:MAG: HEAT repeat domain-containing protein [Bryobacteraceae bacterium]
MWKQCTLAVAVAAAVWGFAAEKTAASRGVLSAHEIERIEALEPQGQAVWLLERVVNQYTGAEPMLRRLLPSWQGKLKLDDRLNSLLNAAHNSSDLGVRGVAIGVTLAARNVELSANTVERLRQSIQDGEGDTPWNLWTLGMLGNRGVEVERVRQILADRLRDANASTRFWAVGSLALLGGKEDLGYLLWMFRHEPDPGVREHAACSVAESGMFTREQRRAAIPELLGMMDDPDLDEQTRSWVFQALQDISGKSFGSDRTAWRRWFGSES